MGAKLTYVYGAMSSGKTTKLLQTRYNYISQGHRVMIAKPEVDTKGDNKVVSRLGLSEKADILITPDSNLYKFFMICKTAGAQPKVILVDEAQFLSENNVNDLCDIVDILGIDVICYGIKLDSNGNMFEGSSALMAKADVLREEISICKCGRRATENLRFNTDTQEFILDGDTICIDGSNSNIEYVSMCRRCARKIRTGEE